MEKILAVAQNMKHRITTPGTCLVQWLRFHISNARGSSPIPDLRTKISHAAQWGQKKKKKKRQNFHTIQQFHSWVPRKRNKNFCLHKNMYTNIHSSFIHNSWKCKQSICPSIRKWMLHVLYSYNGILHQFPLNHKIKRKSFPESGRVLLLLLIQLLTSQNQLSILLIPGFPGQFWSEM